MPSVPFHPKRSFNEERLPLRLLCSASVSLFVQHIKRMPKSDGVFFAFFLEFLIVCLFNCLAILRTIFSSRIWFSRTTTIPRFSVFTNWAVVRTLMDVRTVWKPMTLSLETNTQQLAVAHLWWWWWFIYYKLILFFVEVFSVVYPKQKKRKMPTDARTFLQFENIFVRVKMSIQSCVVNRFCITDCGSFNETNLNNRNWIKNTFIQLRPWHPNQTNYKLNPFILKRHTAARRVDDECKLGMMCPWDNTNNGHVHQFRELKCDCRATVVYVRCSTCVRRGQTSKLANTDFKLHFHWLLNQLQVLTHQMCVGWELENRCVPQKLASNSILGILVAKKVKQFCEQYTAEWNRAHTIASELWSERSKISYKTMKVERCPDEYHLNSKCRWAVAHNRWKNFLSRKIFS